MRRAATIAALLAITFLGSRALAAEPGWALQVGGGALYPSTTDGPFLGRSWSVGFAKPLRPWFLFGCEAGWYRIDGTEGSDYFGDHFWTQPWDAVEGALTFRVQVPVRVGPAPFFAASHGFAKGSGGDVYRYGIASPRGYTVQGFDETVWLSSLALGLRVVVPGRWPDVEASVRKVVWIDSPVGSVVEPRLALAF